MTKGPRTCSARLHGRSAIVTGGSKGIGPWHPARKPLLPQAVRRPHHRFAPQGRHSTLPSPHWRVPPGNGDRGGPPDVNEPRRLPPRRSGHRGGNGHGSGWNIVCANAGIFPSAPHSRTLTPENLGGRVLGGSTLQGPRCTSCRPALSALAASGHGRVVITSSINGTDHRLPPGMVALRPPARPAQLGFSFCATASNGVGTEEHHHQPRLLPGNIITEGLIEMGQEYMEPKLAAKRCPRDGPRQRGGPSAMRLLFFATDEAALHQPVSPLVVDGGTDPAGVSCPRSRSK